MTRHLTIDCDTCVMQHTSTCGDCLVTYICTREPHGAVVIEGTEVRALRLLADVGLVPELRHQRVPGGAAAPLWAGGASGTGRIVGVADHGGFA